MNEPLVLTHVDVTLRLLMALGCGCAIGLNREFHRKPAGFRTFGLVAIGSCIVVMLIELERGSGPDAASRVIQGVLTGIGFLGAGVIFRRETQNKVAGLTTAAAVWLTAGVGMCAGAGQFVIAGAATVLGLGLLLLGGPLERLLTGRSARRRREGSPIGDSKGDASRDDSSSKPT
jgi:putative Mg2+ transporter-C (MgtC) family protein